MSFRAYRLLLPTVCALLLGVVLGRTGTTEQPTSAQAPASAQASSAKAAPNGAVVAPAAATPPQFTMSMRIGTNLYLQTSPEYQAICLQTYRLAEDRLRAILATTKSKPSQSAVVMDLDETVLDNSAFQTYLYRTGQEYNVDLWNDYEEHFGKDVTLVPGAKQFIGRARAMGVNVVFVSNRLKKYQTSTLATMKSLGLDHPNLNDLLYLKRDLLPGETKVSSEKTTRREQIAARFEIAMLIGDNLRDFSEVFVKQQKQLPANPTAKDVLELIEERKAIVDQTAFHFGSDWFILPNPVYGEWDQLIKVDPIDLLHKTSMPVGAR